METDLWQDPMIKAALREGRPASDICPLSCPRCGRNGYYNQGSHFTCAHCRRSWYVLGENEEAPGDGRPSMRADDMITLADTLDSQDL